MLDLQIVCQNLLIVQVMVIIIIPNPVIITTRDLAITIQDLAMIIISHQVHHQVVTFLGQVTAHPPAHLTQEVVESHQDLVHLGVVNLEDNF